MTRVREATEELVLAEMEGASLSLEAMEELVLLEAGLVALNMILRLLKFRIAASRICPCRPALFLAGLAHQSW